MVLLIFCMISIVEVFSASSVLTYKSQDYLRPIVFHSFTIIVGVVVAIIIQNIPYGYFRLMIPSLLLFAVATLLWVILAALGLAAGGIAVFLKRKRRTA